MLDPPTRKTENRRKEATRKIVTTNLLNISPRAVCLLLPQCSGGCTRSIHMTPLACNPANWLLEPRAGKSRRGRPLQLVKGSEARRHEDSCNDAKRVVIAAEKRGDRQQPSIQPALDDPTNSALLLATARKHCRRGSLLP